ncbi:MAG: hypothetical protein ACR2OT_04225 [Parvibaculales bacterium]
MRMLTLLLFASFVVACGANKTVSQSSQTNDDTGVIASKPSGEGRIDETTFTAPIAKIWFEQYKAFDRKAKEASKQLLKGKTMKAAQANAQAALVKAIEAQEKYDTDLRDHEQALARDAHRVGAEGIKK